MIPWLDDDTPFPPIETALAEPEGPNGLLAAGGDLSPMRILDAYRQGIFPWFSPGDPILWWSPDPRMVLFPEEFRLSRSLRKRLRRGEFEVRIDTAFRQVMTLCARTPREGQSGTWITRDMITAYTRLHELGCAHSVEAWTTGTPDGDGRKPRLVGGLYGMAIGRMFYGESMFSLATDASKAAIAYLVRFLHQHGYGLIDCQMNTEHLASLGAREIPRAEFLHRLDALATRPAMDWPAGVLAFEW
jgi:leucyl/phenylalanyl-tRNA--protein transferase